MKIKDALLWGKEELKEVTLRPYFEASLLLSFYLKKERHWLIINENESVDNGFKELILKRKEHKPYEYIVKSVSFYDINLFIDEGVLIPRPETELLIDHTAKIIKENSITKIAEIGVGSGAISIVLARKFPNLKIIATDINPKALNIAKINAKKFNLLNQIEFIETNLIDNINKKIELIVSNPPYISNNFKLEKNVLNYEPHNALFGGEVGDELIKKIILEAKKREIKFLLCEMGYDQKEPIKHFLESLNIKNYNFYKDLAKIDRGFIIKLSFKHL